MKMVTFPDGSTTSVDDGVQFVMQCKGKVIRFMSSKLAIHAWAKANHPTCINDRRTILLVPGQEVVQTIEPGRKAFLPGRFR